VNAEMSAKMDIVFGVSGDKFTGQFSDNKEKARGYVTYTMGQ
jgi:hypothetical protein